MKDIHQAESEVKIDPNDKIELDKSNEDGQVDMSRRSFNMRALVLGLMTITGITSVAIKNALSSAPKAVEKPPVQKNEAGTPTPETQSSPEDEASKIENLIFEHGVEAIDVIGTLCFTDAIAAMAVQEDSKVQKMFVALGIPTYNTGDSGHNKFPLENIHVAIILNAMRSMLDESAKEQSVHEIEATFMGVGLLSGLTSGAKGITAIEGEASAMARAKEEDIQNNPNKVLADSIFQLTVLASLTQLPLTAFGNASIGNGEFGTVQKTYKSLYVNLLPPIGGEESESKRTLIRDTLLNNALKTNNPVIADRVRKLLAEDGNLITFRDYQDALGKLAQQHTNDLMTILMSTACDDAQASMGDAGPLVGLAQSFGPDFVAAIPAILPYTLMIGLERGTLAAKRAGIAPSSVFTRERVDYALTFLKTTWHNLLVYLVNKVGVGLQESNGTAGRRFSVFGSFETDLNNFFGSLRDALLGSFNGDTLDLEKVSSAVAIMKKADMSYNARLGRALRVKAQEEEGDSFAIDKTKMLAIKRGEMGMRSTNPMLADVQKDIDRMAFDSPDHQAVLDFVEKLKDLRANHMDELMQSLNELYVADGRGEKKPSLKAAARVLQGNPKIQDLLDINYWHHRIGPELTDTIFVVFLQGMHLPFLISFFDRYVYNADWFKTLPLGVQEWISVALNDFISMFADNWADAMAHSKWLTTMYFNELSKAHVALAEEYKEAKPLVDGDFFEIEEKGKKHIPELFSIRRQQFAALIANLQSKHPEDTEKLNATLEEYYENSDTYYYKAMVMAMLSAVTGGGKALTGNSPHFTFAAGFDEYTLGETLADFRNHPVYHLWEFIFSTSYSTMLGPKIAKGMFGMDVDKEVRNVLQRNFRQQFPEFEKKLQELQNKDRTSSHLNGGSSEIELSRRDAFGRVGRIFGFGAGDNNTVSTLT